MQAFHNDVAVKEKYVSRLKEHHKLDHIIQKVGWEKNGHIRGCAVGCTLENYSHAAYETELGIPEWLARLEDAIFEGLPKKDAPKFAVDFLTSIRVGANLDSVKWKFCAFVLKENIERVLSLKNIDDKLREQVVTSIQGVLKLHEAAVVSGKWDESADSAAASAAWSAADSADSAAWSAARSADSAAASAAWSAARSAWSAARSADSAAASAAWSADSAARSAAASAAYKKYAKELIKLLKAQPSGAR